MIEPTWKRAGYFYIFYSHLGTNPPQLASSLFPDFPQKRLAADKAVEGFDVLFAEVMGLPTFQIYRNGEQVASSTGVKYVCLFVCLFVCLLVHGKNV